MVIYKRFCNFKNEELKTKIKTQNDKIENLQNSLEFNKLQGDYNPDSTKVSIVLKTTKLFITIFSNKFIVIFSI